MLKNLIFNLFALVVATVSVTAGLLPGQDAYVIRRDALVLPGGINRPATAHVIRRTAPGTYVPGIIVVKTRLAHGLARQQTSIGGSMANQDLASLNIREVNSAFAHTGDADLSHLLGMDRIYNISYDEAVDPFDACARLMDNPDIEYAVPCYTHKLFYAPNDALYGQQPWMGSMKVDKAWDVTKGASSVIIAIVDSGTDWQHADLSANIWTNAREIPANNIDDDSNGYVDDVRGWDFVGNVSLAEVQSGIVRPDNDPRVNGQITDYTGHGTVVGGCAGASTNNGTGVASTGFRCRIIPIKCGSDNTGYRGILRGYEAIKYAADLGAHIINCSWGGGGLNPAGQDVIDYATSKGSLVIAASGNDGLDNDSYLQSPASFDGVLSVGSCSVSDRVSGFSNYGMNVDLYAPGEAILSTFPNNQYRALTGTSFSSPLTAGIAGLVKAVHPDWTPHMIAAQLRGTVDPLQGVTADTKPKFWGRVNAERAVKVNASFTSGERMPGLMIKSTEIGGSATGRITSLNRTTIKFTIKNVLADAQNVVIIPRVLSNNVNYLGNVTISLGSINKDGEASGTFDVQLSPNYPWSSSTLDIALTMTSGTYSNFEIIAVDVELPTTNSFTRLVGEPSSSWELVDFSTDGALHATGMFLGQRGLATGTQTGVSGWKSIPFVATALESFSASTIFLGGLSSNVPTISRSTTGGNSWSGINVGAFSASVEGIRMYDAQNGISIGNPVAGKYGIGKTVNGGAAWTAVTTAPLSTGSDRIVSGAISYHGSAIFVGTANRKILTSLNRGQTWSQGSLGISGASIVSIAFRDSSDGIVLYRVGVANDAPYRIATSTNGGANWQAGTTNLALGFTPQYVNAGPTHFLLIGSGGEVSGSDNNGTDWQPILSKSAGNVVRAQALMLNRPSIFLWGQNVSLLQYRYAGPNGTKLPQFSTSQVSFGVMEPGQTRTRTATLKNNGTSDITVSKFETVSIGATPTGAFIITISPKTTVPAGGSISIPMRCSGSDTGTYTGTLRVTSDGTPNVIEISLLALVSPATSVHEDLFALGSVTVGPNPVANALTITGSAQMQVSLIALDGTVVYRSMIEPGVSVVDVRFLSTGVYHLILAHGMRSHTMPITIMR